MFGRSAGEGDKDLRWRGISSREHCYRSVQAVFGAHRLEGNSLHSHFVTTARTIRC